MLTKQEVQAALKADLSQQAPHLNANQVVDSLSVGLTLSRNLLLKRIHEDVQSHHGVDSMIAPVSPRDEKFQLERASEEIEMYSCIVVADEIARSEFLDQPEPWLLDRLFQLRLGEKCEVIREERVSFYQSESIEDRRLKFLAVLQRAMPESARAPLVLFRLFPRGVRIVAAVAFGDPLRAQELRSEQNGLLPAISDCFECHGQVLDNEEMCRVCENPVWKYHWLQSSE